jgi:hypothetical protein
MSAALGGGQLPCSAAVLTEPINSRKVADSQTAYFPHGASRSRRGGLFDQFSEAESLVELAHQNEATVGGDPRSLEIDLQGAIEGELKGLVLFLPPRRADPQSLFSTLKPT